MIGVPQKNNSLLAWRPHIVRKIVKMYSERWTILREIYLVSSSYNKHEISIQKLRFHIYIPGILNPRIEIEK